MSSLSRWFVADAAVPAEGAGRRVEWLRVVPFLALHVGAVAAPFVGVRWIDIVFALSLYALRMFAITAFYHRYFSHRAFKTSRGWQFVFALLGASATQRGPLWWASVHRRHHAGADTEADPHAPQHGFWYSHVGWFLTRDHFATDARRVRDWARYPELRLLDRYDVAVPLVLAGGLYGIGAALEPLGTSALQLMLWGYCVSTVALLHVTLLVNSVAHRIGTRRFDTRDDSRNVAWLAVLTFGEGWHNNHHRYAGAARQGFFPGELDVSFELLKVLARLGIVRDLKPVPARVLAEGAGAAR
jgi:stearoyl-CoA desaturase (delta-9 desaturase)